MDADVLVIGGNPGGCSAAIAAARSGMRVLLMEPTRTLGGMNANGAFGFDSATPQALSGIAEEVQALVREHYARIGLDDPLFTRRADQVWESHVAANVWRTLVQATPGITILWGAVPVAVTVAGRMITGIDWVPAVDPVGNIDPDCGAAASLRARMVIDASYEADVSAWSGVRCNLGREPRSWLEPHAGRIFSSNMERSAQGYLPHSVLPGSTGEGDDAIMAFVSRLHCRIYEDRSPGAAHRLKSAPPGYDPANYAWGPVATAADGSPVYFNTLYVLVNGKFLLNRMTRGNNLVGPNREYILAHPAARRALRQRFVDHALGYLYFVQNDGGMPGLGLAHDEFVDNDHIPYLVYTRESRRIDGLKKLTEADITPYITGDGCRPPLKADAVAIGDWTLESHGCTDAIRPGDHYPEGFIFNRVTQTPYQIPYGCLLPREIDNLIVPGAISATHIAASATRCEAARIQTGIAAGVAAAMALQAGCAPAQVPVRAIQAALIARGGKLTYFADVASSHAHFASIQWAALRSWLPQDDEWRFFPDHPASWADLVRAVVLCLALPVSVSGAHFEGIHRRHPLFRFVEALYDLGTRVDVDLFDATRLENQDPMVEILRLDRAPRLIPFAPDAAITQVEAGHFLGKAAIALGAGQAPRFADLREDVLLTRGLLCALIKVVDDATVAAGAVNAATIDPAAGTARADALRA